MNTDIFRNCVICKDITNDLWIFKLRPNSKIWLVKENCFGIVHKWVCNTRDYDPSGMIVRITFKRPINNAWVRERWLVRPNGTGFDFSQILMPVNRVYSIGPYQVTYNEIKKRRFGV